MCRIKENILGPSSIEELCDKNITMGVDIEVSRESRLALSAFKVYTKEADTCLNPDHPRHELTTARTRETRQLHEGFQSWRVFVRAGVAIEVVREQAGACFALEVHNKVSRTNLNVKWRQR